MKAVALAAFLSLALSIAAPAQHQPGVKVPLGDFLWMNQYYYGARAELAGTDFVRVSGRNGSVKIPFEKAPAKVKAALEKERAALLAERAVQAKAVARAKWRAENKLTFLDGKVHQITDGGLLFIQDRTLDIYFIAGKWPGLADGDALQLNAQRVGVHEYTTVLGAKKTVPSMTHTPFPADLQ